MIFNDIAGQCMKDMKKLVENFLTTYHTKHTM